MQLDECIASQGGMSWKDSEGNELYLKDTVSYTGQTDMFGEEKDEQDEGIIIAFPSQEMVLIQPLAGGTSIPVPPEEIKQVRSIIKDIADLSNNEELQALLTGAEERYEKALLESPTRRKKGGKTAKPAKKAKPNPFGNL